MRNHLKLIGIFAIIVCLSPIAASAEVQLCDGVWTNGPCNGPISKEFLVSRAPTPSAQEKALSDRKLWLHDLDMLRLKAKRNYDLDASIEHVRAKCLDSEIESSVCAQLIAQREEEIQSLIIARQSAEAEKQEVKSQPEGSPRVVIVDNRDSHRRPGYYITDGRGHRRGVHPIPGRASHRHRHEESSASVSANVTSSDGRASLGINAGTSSRSSAGTRSGFIGN